MSLMFNISSAIIVLPDKNTLSMFDISSMYDHRPSCFCLTEIKPVSLMFDRWSMIIVLYFVFYRYKYRVLNVRQMIYGSAFFICLYSRLPAVSLLIVWHIINDLPSISLCLPELNTVLIVRHFICEHRCFCLCHPAINTVSVMFDISSMLTVVYYCLFHSSLPYHIVRHIIHDHASLCLCFPELNIVSLLFDTWSMIIIVYGRVSRVAYHVFIVWHIIYDLPFLCLCLPELNSVSLLFDVSFMVTVVNVYVFQR